MGLYGAIIIDDGTVQKIVDGKIIEIPVKDIKMDYVLYMDSNLEFHGMSINNTSGLQTPVGINPTLTAKDDTLVRFSVIGVGNLVHTFHLHGNKWLDPGTTQVIDTAIIAPMTKHQFVITAGGYGSGVGDWLFHCHFYDHMQAGMSGTFKVT